MGRRAPQYATILLLALLAFLFFGHRLHRTLPHLVLPASSMQHEPLQMLWAWQTPEDLSALDTTHTGVAFFSRELFLTNHVAVMPRSQPLHVAPATFLMADVRMQTQPNFSPSPALTQQTADAILAALQAPNVRALQIDFDATASQQDFYAAVLRLVRAHLPAGIPLSITALVSWCASPSWLHNLPVDEAVPMFFRMGGPAVTRATRPKDIRTITEPLCASSVGIATDETWPAIAPQQRVYVFQSGPWRAEDIAHLNTIGYQSLKGVLPQ